jgi:hypothetical protein
MSFILRIPIPSRPHLGDSEVLSITTYIHEDVLPRIPCSRLSHLQEEGHPSSSQRRPRYRLFQLIS